MMLPPPPLPPREAFDSDEEYEAARIQREQDVQRHIEADKSVMAVFIVIFGLALVGCAWFLLSETYSQTGLRGLVYLALGAGLFWAAYSRVRMWLDRL